jgi:hypothetical protein
MAKSADATEPLPFQAIAYPAVWRRSLELHPRGPGYDWQSHLRTLCKLCKAYLASDPRSRTPWPLVPAAEKTYLLALGNVPVEMLARCARRLAIMAAMVGRPFRQPSETGACDRARRPASTYLIVGWWAGALCMSNTVSAPRELSHGLRLHYVYMATDARTLQEPARTLELLRGYRQYWGADDSGYKVYEAKLAARRCARPDGRPPTTTHDRAKLRP